MNTTSKDHQEWESCKSGFLVAFSNRAKSARRQVVAIRASASALVILLILGFGVWSAEWWLSPRENYFGGIACHEVQENMPAMLAGTLPDELKARIEAHLRECPVCQEMMQKMQVGQATASGFHKHWACNCPQCQQRWARAIVDAVGSIEIESAVVAVSLPSPSYSDRH